MNRCERCGSGIESGGTYMIIVDHVDDKDFDLSVANRDELKVLSPTYTHTYCKSCVDKFFRDFVHTGSNENPKATYIPFMPQPVSPSCAIDCMDCDDTGCLMHPVNDGSDCDGDL